MIATAPVPIANSPGFSSVVALRVAEVVQPIDQLPLGQRLAAAQLERPREDARKHRVALAVQARVDQPREADVVVGGGEAQDDRRERRARARRARTQRLRQSAATRIAARPSSNGAVRSASFAETDRPGRASVQRRPQSLVPSP